MANIAIVRLLRCALFCTLFNGQAHFRPNLLAQVREPARFLCVRDTGLRFKLAE